MRDSQSTSQREKGSATDAGRNSHVGPRKKPRALVIVISLVGLAVCLCAAASLYAVFGLKESPYHMMLIDQPRVTAVADQFMKEMAKKDAEAAFALFSTTAQEYVALSDLERFLRDDLYDNFEGYESLSVQEGGSFDMYWDVSGDEPQMPHGTVATLVAVVKYQGGFEGTLTGTFEKEDGEWRVYKLDVVAPPSKMDSP